ncbi:LLM class flavin-dependent oxidoreductase [Sphingomonas crocodyli]|uniref:LLM class flavin-dependent oxidoreductase n=1 Tax=Sphingomonas crocodyli TaxID=1979270 RepID=A0A437M0L3_9SPHN|nr:LLM class flavin-dependent oxidoreductase [Sphingomonas crocodyli]RVT91125.1 LLM class flavin-dependent oxidoreductase [Sphingomonas crocodyli]
MFTFRFDMRAPSFGAPARDLYTAAIEMTEWAEDKGLLAALLCEHHGAEDGYLPAPLILASAIAARTKKVPLSIAIIQLPFYDPVRLAEEMSVIDIISGGRVSYVGGLGYLPAEYEMMGEDFKSRGKIADEKLSLLLKAKTGEPFEHEGRRIHVTPPPFTPGGPRMGWGGGSPPAARRAGKHGLDFMAQKENPALGELYAETCRANGHTPGACFLPPRDMPTTTFVAEDVDKAWEELGDFLMHDVLSYAKWNEGNDDTSSLSFVKNAAELRAENRSHRIMSVDEAVGWVKGGMPLSLHPLIGGLPPELGWKYLRIVTDKVLPQLR